MTAVYASFFCFIILSLFVSLYGHLKYNDALNALTLSSAFFLVPNALALPYLLIFGSKVEYEVIATTYYLSTLYLFFFAIPFLFSGRVVELAIKGAYNYLGFYSRYMNKTDYYALPAGIFIILFLTSFILLAQIGGGGVMWLLDPRDAYMDYRRGAGMFYAASTWFLSISAFYVLWYCRNRITILLATVFYVIIASFLGSKGLLLVIGIVALSSYHYRFRKIRLITLIIVGFVLIALFMLTQILQGSARSLLHAFQYFNYFESSARLIEKFDNGGTSHTLGLIFIEDFLNNVPRYFYPDKPIIFGKSRIQEILNPGLLQRGRAVGVLSWVEYYTDFYVFGVVLFAFIKGVLAKAFYQLFRLNPQNLLLYLCVMQFSIFTVINYSTFILFVLLLLGSKFIIRMFAKKVKFG